ncbi:hypothetical protein BJI49_11470 [Acetobacter pasteurianus]|nr:hypothetical protein BJI49_11470 [Acetobacter pasteurianus]
MFTLNGQLLITVFGRLLGVSQAAMGGEAECLVSDGNWKTGHSFGSSFYSSHSIIIEIKICLYINILFIFILLMP